MLEKETRDKRGMVRRNGKNKGFGTEGGKKMGTRNLNNFGSLEGSKEKSARDVLCAHEEG